MVIHVKFMDIHKHSLCKKNTFNTFTPRNFPIHKRVMKKAKLLDSVVEKIGPLDQRSIQLLNLTAILSTKSNTEIEEHIGNSLNIGINPSEIYQAIMSVSGSIGIKKVINSLEIAQRIININFQSL